MLANKTRSIINLSQISYISYKYLISDKWPTRRRGSSVGIAKAYGMDGRGSDVPLLRARIRALTLTAQEVKEGMSSKTKTK